MIPWFEGLLLDVCIAVVCWIWFYDREHTFPIVNAIGSERRHLSQSHFHSHAHMLPLRVGQAISWPRHATS